MDLTHDEIVHRENNGCDPFWDVEEESTDVRQIAVAADRQIVTRITCVRNQIVGYAIMANVYVDDEWKKLARIDTDHKCVHMHKFDRAGKQKGLREWRSDLAPCDQSHPSVVGDSYASSYTAMFDLLGGFDEQSWN